MKKILLLAALVLALSGCVAAPEPVEMEPPESAPLSVETLTVEFAPTGGDPAAQMRLLSPVAEKLKTALAAAGVEAEEVLVTLGTSQAATGQAVAQGHVNLAFLPAETLAEFGGSAAPLLSAAWPAPSCTSGDPADWNGEKTTWTKDFAAGRRVLVVAGPSAYGRNLAARMAAGGVTWEELSRARWGLAGGRADGMAALWLAEQYEGKTLSDLPETAGYQSEDELLFALAAAEVDVIPIIADNRIDAAERWTRSRDTGGFGRGGFIWDETCVLGVTEPFFGTTVAAAPDSPWQEAAWSGALEAALAALRDDADLAALAGAGPLAPVSGDALKPVYRLLALEKGDGEALSQSE